MKSLCRAAFFVAAVILLPQYPFAGQLNPPGPPTAGTMKPLDVVEPRTAIRQSDIPLTINTSGSYYLAENITSSQTSIVITADDVTLDMCGFTLKGSDAQGYSGVYMWGRRNVEIRNGTIRDFSIAVNDGSTTGHGIRLVNLRLLSNLLNAIVCIGANGWVENCTISENGMAGGASQYGIRVGQAATVIGNKVYKNFNSATGMVFCVSADLGSRIAGNTIYNNANLAQGAFGIDTREGCIVADNTIYGIGDHATVLVRGIEASECCTIVGNTVNRNGTYSVDVWGFFCGHGSTIIRNTSYENGTNATGIGNGIAVGAHSMVDQNTAYNNCGSNLLVRPDSTYGINHAP